VPQHGLFRRHDVFRQAADQGVTVLAKQGAEIAEDADESSIDADNPVAGGALTQIEIR
jgi:hypothetical protein